VSRVAIVPSAGTGIGAAAATLPAERGLYVVLVGRRQGLLETVRGEIVADFCSAIANCED
jgi:NADP-dependent 3-hydroxy acid dehydrogenase YdfG